MNRKSPMISHAPPFVLRLSKDERKVFQQNLPLTVGNDQASQHPRLSNFVGEGMIFEISVITTHASGKLNNFCSGLIKCSWPSLVTAQVYSTCTVP